MRRDQAGTHRRRPNFQRNDAAPYLCTAFWLQAYVCSRKDLEPVCGCDSEMVNVPIWCQMAGDGSYDRGRRVESRDDLHGDSEEPIGVGILTEHAFFDRTARLGDADKRTRRRRREWMGFRKRKCSASSRVPLGPMVTRFLPLTGSSKCPLVLLHRQSWPAVLSAQMQTLSY
jgi:hypothetical protein